MTKYSGRTTATIWIGALASSWALVGLAAFAALTVAHSFSW